METKSGRWMMQVELDEQVEMMRKGERSMEG